ncbi:radical SAM protein, partial [bacterium]|nr:radical SAM protein [bacterium]
MMKESLLYERLSNQEVRCHICQRRCRIKENESGYCHTRVNHKGTLFSTIYGEVSTYHKAPIEIKPVYHFLPGSYALSLGSVGCNFLCPGCQNWEISFTKTKQLDAPTTFISPEESIQLAKKLDCQGISWTYNEPTLWFEYTLDGARLAKTAGLYTSYVTNGYITPEALDLIAPYLDTYRVDIKAFNHESYQKIAHISDWEGILDVIQRTQKKWNIHIEIVTNIIPGINDDVGQLKSLAQWIKNNL